MTTRHFARDIHDGAAWVASRIEQAPLEVARFVAHVREMARTARAP
jgi:hypothetical protein